ncbi:MAG: hypothetical protein HY654_02580, partial [Acidobacteria bacterium]|nr:hypothetical protein [Acidobacteriota bacterium]
MQARLAVLLILALVPGASAPASASEHDRPHAPITRVADDNELEAVAITAAAEVIELDGAPDDAIWSRAPVVSGFRQRDPAEGAEPTFRTEARAAFDDRALYVIVRA